MKKFNTTAVCIPSKHYMVDISERVAEIKKMVDAGDYFTISRARQYGKTTTLKALQEALEEKYVVLSLSFEGLTKSNFASEQSFVKAFCRLLKKNTIRYATIPEAIRNQFEENLQRKDDKPEMDELFITFGEWCSISDKPIVLSVDEVDSATNNQVFLDFLGLLRDGYISRDTDQMPAFQSVILAGVTDVKHLKSKIRPEEKHEVNSPWNTREGNEPGESLLSSGDCPRDQTAPPFDIAADFNIDMSLSESGIKGMLEEYEADHNTGMDAGGIAKAIREYTSGYPYLVSRICQKIDEALVPKAFSSLADAWTVYGVDEAVKQILSEPDNSLFESLTGKLTNYPELRKRLRAILMRGEILSWSPYDEEQSQLFMYGFIRNDHNRAVISNRIFEMMLYSQFIEESNENNDLKQLSALNKSMFVTEDGWLDIPKIMDHFIKEHNRIHKDNTVKFLEEEGRERFITYVSGIINGTGTYSVEEQLRDYRRTDLVIHYLGRRYVIEMKIWHGERYNEEGEKQIIGYLDYWNLDTGYMLSFNFNKEKETGVKRIQIGKKVLFEGVV